MADVGRDGARVSALALALPVRGGSRRVPLTRRLAIDLRRSSSSLCRQPGRPRS